MDPSIVLSVPLFKIMDQLGSLNAKNMNFAAVIVISLSQPPH